MEQADTKISPAWGLQLHIGAPASELKKVDYDN
jgi:hypothetical protein